MRNKIIFILAIIGLLTGLVSAYIFGIEKKPMPPAFTPASNPYTNGIYAEGIVESYQANGANINIYPEVPGTIKQILVSEGEIVKKGTPLILIDDAVQRATCRAAEGAGGVRERKPQKLSGPVGQTKKIIRTGPEIREQERPGQRGKRGQSGKGKYRSNAETVRTRSNAAVQVHHKGAGGRRRSCRSMLRSAVTYRRKARTIPIRRDSTRHGHGKFANIYRRSDVISMKYSYPDCLKRRKCRRQMFIRGTNINIPLEYVRVQPYVSPKIELSNQRTERVDVRVLPVIFRFERPKDIDIYPGQLVDVYIGETETRDKKYRHSTMTAKTFSEKGHVIASTKADKLLENSRRRSTA